MFHWGDEGAFLHGDALLQVTQHSGGFPELGPPLVYSSKVDQKFKTAFTAAKNILQGENSSPEHFMWYATKNLSEGTLRRRELSPTHTSTRVCQILEAHPSEEMAIPPPPTKASTHMQRRKAWIMPCKFMPDFFNNVGPPSEATENGIACPSLSTDPATALSRFSNICQMVEHMLHQMDQKYLLSPKSNPGQNESGQSGRLTWG